MDILKRIRAARRVYLIGNGGSHANAEHIANDLLSVGIKAFTPNTAFLTATANDKDYDSVFSRWLKVVAEKGDLLIALSGSGTSPNIVRAVRLAKRMGMDVELITDYLRTLDMQQSEEVQLTIGHEWMRCLKKN